MSLPKPKEQEFKNGTGAAEERPQTPASMLLETVSVPEAFAPIFQSAQTYVQQYFSDRIEDPRHSSILISGERYILVRAASMSVEFFDLVKSLYQEKGEEEARRVANNLLFDIAKAIGKADAKSFHNKMGVTNPIERLSAGPVHFSYAGWAFVRIHEESRPSADENFYLIYDHPFSFESDAWLRSGQIAPGPVCIMNAGYSSGWCEESFGIPLVAAEVECTARGDAECKFIMATPERIEERLAEYRRNQCGGTPGTEPSVAGHGAIAVPEFFQRKRLEEELRRSHEALEEKVEQRTAEVMRAYKQLKEETTERLRMEDELRQSQKMEAVGQLAGGIAHDFNNLLNVILGYAEFLEQGSGGPASTPKHAKKITDAANKAAALTRQLLAFSRKQVLAPKVMELNQVVTGMAKLLSRVLGENLELMLRLSAGPALVKADQVQMEQVIMNLAVNARDAMPKGGVLAIETALESRATTETRGALRFPRGEFVRLTVRDTGEGIEEEVRSHIFEPFFTTKTRGKGTGLGLATVYGVVKQSGGTIQVESEVGHGTAFHIFLPQVHEELPDISVEVQSPTRLEGSGTVLVVEDEEALLEAVSEYLKNLGYMVLSAANGLEGLNIAKEYKGEIHTVITDVVMPKISGPDMVALLRPLRPTIQVIFVSGYADETVMLEPGSGGVLHFLQKPFELRALARKVKEITGSRRIVAPQ